MIQLGAMPLPSLFKLHPEAKVTPEELAILKPYLAPWTPLGPIASRRTTSTAAQGSAEPRLFRCRRCTPELNGFPFDPAFESWKPISTTDRGDNNTFRFILGNDMAVKAAQAGNISPWPDGARFAKIAWQQELGPDGLVHSGQVRAGRADAERCAALQIDRRLGLGTLARAGPDALWRRRADFVNECTGCHRPLYGNDYVYTLPISPANVGRGKW